MTKYEFLLLLDEMGMLETLFTDFESTKKYEFWMEIYADHRTNPKLSQLDLSFSRKTSHSTVQRAIAFMNQQLTCQPKFWVEDV